MATKKDIEKILRKAEGKKAVKKAVKKKAAKKKKKESAKTWPSGIPKATKKQANATKKRNQASLERMAAAERARLGGRSFVEYDHNPSKLRIVHRSPNGGRVWRDAEWGQYRYAPAGVGPRGVRGDDVNVGFSDDLQDAIASLAETERRGVRRENPRNEYLIWFPPLMTDQGTMPGHYDVVSDLRDVRMAEKFGGIHVSHDAGAWAEYDRERREGYYDGFTD